jgi:glutaredoxin
VGGAIASCQHVSLDQLVAPSYEFQLAEYLSNTGAKMYGAYWCPHCARQKHLFGDAALSIPYVECDPRGVNAQVDLCNAIGINAYPTWEIRGEFYLGAQPLKRLAILSGFEQASEPVEVNEGEWGGFSPAP